MNTTKEELTFHYDKIITETTNAWLVSIDNKEIWLPKSQCGHNTQDKSFYIPEWLAIEKELI